MDMYTREAQLAAFSKLLDVMDELREKCPWDRKQTMESLRPLTIEECYELTDAILGGKPHDIRNELGDVLLHIVFYAKIGSELGVFDMASVCTALVEKLVHRHPHIYGDVQVDNEEQVKANWEKIKLKEGKKSVFEGVPKGLPSMVKAIRLQEKAKGVGFEWPDHQGAWDKVEEELAELREATSSRALSSDDVEKEFGDLIFSLINVSRYLGINADNALDRTNVKFKARFEHIESAAMAMGKNLKDMDLNEMDTYWDQAKTLHP
jgi:XTP/dITP diphosphohydrolase